MQNKAVQFIAFIKQEQSKNNFTPGRHKNKCSYFYKHFQQNFKKQKTLPSSFQVIVHATEILKFPTVITNANLEILFI